MSTRDDAIATLSSAVCLCGGVRGRLERRCARCQRHEHIGRIVMAIGPVNWRGSTTQELEELRAAQLEGLEALGALMRAAAVDRQNAQIVIGLAYGTSVLGAARAHS